MGQLSHSRRHLKTDYYSGKSRNISKEKSKKYKSTMCSSSPVKEKDQEKKSATATSCCPGSFSRTRKVARALVKRLHTNPCKMDKNDAIIEVIGGQNNENLPPDEMSNGSSLFKKKYTVNKKRSAQESFDRLRKHVPAIQADPNASQLDVLLEAIQYIQNLRKDLGNDENTPMMILQQQQQKEQQQQNEQKEQEQHQSQTYTQTDV